MDAAHLIGGYSLVMAGIEEADSFYATVRAEIESKLNHESLASPSHWIVLKGTDGTPTTCRLDDETE
jgi:hypothetical protein